MRAGFIVYRVLSVCIGKLTFKRYKALLQIRLLLRDVAAHRQLGLRAFWDFGIDVRLHDYLQSA